jgi:hypothetical protein
MRKFMQAQLDLTQQLVLQDTVTWNDAKTDEAALPKYVPKLFRVKNIVTNDEPT